MQQTRPVFRVKRERSEREGEREKETEGERESKTPRARRTEEGGEGWLEEGVGTSLTVQPTSYALGPTFRRLLSFSRPLFSSLIHSLILPVSFSVSALSSTLPPLSRYPPSPCFYRPLSLCRRKTLYLFGISLRPVDSRKSSRDSFSISRNLVKHKRRAFRSSVEGGKVPWIQCGKNLGFVQVESRRQARAYSGTRSN